MELDDVGSIIAQSKLHAVVAAQGRPIQIALTLGQEHDSTMAASLFEHARGRPLIADTGYDADCIVAAVHARAMKPVIHCHPTRKRKRRLDRKRYPIRKRG